MSYIFWGYIFVLFDLNLNGLDILPDFIGYALIFAGVHKLSVMSHHFGKARIFAAVMFLIALSELISTDPITVELDIFFVLMMAANIVVMFIPIYLMYLITRGVADLEQQCQAYLGADTLHRVWNLVLIVAVLFLAVTVITIGTEPFISLKLLLASLTAVGMLIVNIAWVVCFYIAKKRYKNAEQYNYLSQNMPLVHTKSLLFALIAGMLIFGLTMLSYSEYAHIMRNGLSYVEHFASEDYRFTEHAVSDSDYVTINWDDVQSAVGKELYRDGDCVIYISDIQDDRNGGYRIFFTAEGAYGYQSGRLVTPLSHKDTLEKDGATILSNIHQNWPNDAVLQVVIGDKTYSNAQWCARAQTMEPGIDEIGYSMFANEYYERGEMVLTDEIRENGNQVRIRLIGLREVEYHRR